MSRSLSRFRYEAIAPGSRQCSVEPCLNQRAENRRVIPVQHKPRCVSLDPAILLFPYSKPTPRRMLWGCWVTRLTSHQFWQLVRLAGASNWQCETSDMKPHLQLIDHCRAKIVLLTIQNVFTSWGSLENIDHHRAMKSYEDCMDDIAQ